MSIPNNLEFAGEFYEDMSKVYIAEGYGADTIVNNIVLQLLILNGTLTIDDISQAELRKNQPGDRRRSQVCRCAETEGAANRVGESPQIEGTRRPSPSAAPGQAPRLFRGIGFVSSEVFPEEIWKHSRR